MNRSLVPAEVFPIPSSTRHQSFLRCDCIMEGELSNKTLLLSFDSAFLHKAVQKRKLTLLPLVQIA